MTAGAIDPIEHWTTIRPMALVVRMVWKGHDASSMRLGTPRVRGARAPA